MHPKRDHALNLLLAVVTCITVLWFMNFLQSHYKHEVHGAIIKTRAAQ